MALHFTPAEFARRRAALEAAMAAEELDALLLFSQESMYWLTGYDTFGFCFFQCLIVRPGREDVLLTRSADLRQAQHTSTIADIRIWKDGAGAAPARDLAAAVEGLTLRGRTLGVEYEAHGLTAANGKRLEAALGGFAILVEASHVVPRLRAVKSAEEIAHVRRAAELAEAAHEAALDEIRPGADEGAILARQHEAIFRGGGDYPGNEFIIGSGRDALLCRYKSGRRVLGAPDQITLEFAGVYRHYHAAIMHTVCVGESTPRHRAYHAACAEALAGCAAELRPGRAAHDVFAAHARAFDAAGLGSHRLNACGYSLGAKFTPSWMDPPMFYENNPWALAAGMVVFVHMILMDSESGTAMCLGRTYLIGPDAPELLCGARTDVLVRG
jgi:Xaa-Pro dipeptidase